MLAVLIERVGIVPAFSTAVAVALALQAGSLWALRRGPVSLAGRRGMEDRGS
jgi:hypothetical protein